ncbi:MAG: hypothetical protein ACI9K5_003613 [Gammaproteobacteria bacterium]
MSLGNLVSLGNLALYFGDQPIAPEGHRVAGPDVLPVGPGRKREVRRGVCRGRADGEENSGTGHAGSHLAEANALVVCLGELRGVVGGRITSEVQGQVVRQGQPGLTRVLGLDPGVLHPAARNRELHALGSARSDRDLCAQGDDPDLQVVDRCQRRRSWPGKEPWSR